MAHPFHDVAIVGVHNTAQARRLESHDNESINLEGALGAIADAGVPLSEIDAVIGEFAQELVLALRLGPCIRLPWRLGIPLVLEAADLIASGRANVVLVAAGGAALYRERSAVAPWTRPSRCCPPTGSRSPSPWRGSASRTGTPDPSWSRRRSIPCPAPALESPAGRG